MPYFHDKDLLVYVEREIIPGLVEDCIAEFYVRFGVSLDVSPPSLVVIDTIIRDAGLAPERDSLSGPIGAYLGAVLCSSDGARWNPAFNRERGVDGYQTSRVSLYNQDVDVFDLAAGALVGFPSLHDTFTTLHRPIVRINRTAGKETVPLKS
ncbi:MAG: hypothetical protein M3Y56_01195 [Armatimonadota bacterium]|nr:hypothetical protein [Armatimonadota bacterium]